MAQSKEMKALISQLEKIQDGINPIIKKAFNSKQAEVLKYNTEKQLFKKGERSDGLKLTPAYADSTKSYKRKRGQRISNVTLKDSGDFYNSIRVYPADEEVEIKTDGSLNYSKFLEGRYGAEIYGLQDKFIKEFYNRFISKPVTRFIQKAVK